MSDSAFRAEALGLSGVQLLHGLRHPDARGYLRKVVVLAAARELGLDIVVDEVVCTSNNLEGTVRGLHYQVPPFEERKTLWVTSGSVFDVLVDVRPAEPTYGSWIAVHLSESDDVALHIPPGVAHGYQTLEDSTSITYLMSGAFSAAHARTLRWDDPTVAIDWPRPVTLMSDTDKAGALWTSLE